MPEFDFTDYCYFDYTDLFLITPIYLSEPLIFYDYLIALIFQPLNSI